jgi:hypothetical protein
MTAPSVRWPRVTAGVAIVLLPALLLPAPRLARAEFPKGYQRGSLYDYIATPAFAEAARAYYLNAIAADPKRQKLIDQAKEECGGRYEDTAVHLVELSHTIETDKEPLGPPGKTYAVEYLTAATTQWLVVESIFCSLHGGHAQSVLHAVFLTGTETAKVTYHFVNDKDVGKPQVSDVKRQYKIDADALAEQYRTPYSQQ